MALLVRSITFFLFFFHSHKPLPLPLLPSLTLLAPTVMPNLWMPRAVLPSKAASLPLPTRLQNQCANLSASSHHQLLFSRHFSLALCPVVHYDPDPTILDLLSGGASSIGSIPTCRGWPWC